MKQGKAKKVPSLPKGATAWELIASPSEPWTAHAAAFVMSHHPGPASRRTYLPEVDNVLYSLECAAEHLSTCVDIVRKSPRGAPILKEIATQFDEASFWVADAMFNAADIRRLVPQTEKMADDDEDDHDDGDGDGEGDVDRDDEAEGDGEGEDTETDKDVRAKPGLFVVTAANDERVAANDDVADQ